MDTENFEAMSSELKRIETKIGSLIEGAFTSGRSTYLLSQLGQDLGPDDLSSLKAITRGTLKEFLEKRFSKEIEIVTRGVNRNIFALSPIGHRESAEEVLFEAPSTPNKQKQVRFDRRLWAAFSMPFAPGKDARLLDLSSLRFRDVDADSEAPEGFALITSGFISNSQHGSNKAEEVVKNIQSWISESGLEIEHFFEKPRTQLKSRSDFAPLTRSEISVLELMIQSLDRRQLQSINLPLDVVESLLNKRI